MTNAQTTAASQYIAFDGFRRIARGDLREVARATKVATDQGSTGALFIVDATTSGPLEIDLRGSVEEVLGRLPDMPDITDVPEMLVAPDAPGNRVARVAPVAPAEKSRGRPRLGVVAREVTLLPRHWAWLADQPGGASAALRRLVEHARAASGERDALRHAQESAYRFMSTLLGDQPDYDEAARALFAGRGDRFRAIVRSWPADARDHLLELADAVFAFAPRAG